MYKNDVCMIGQELQPLPGNAKVVKYENKSRVIKEVPLLPLKTHFARAVLGSERTLDGFYNQ